MTYMGKPYYPAWLDNLADDVTLEAAAMDGVARGAETVRSILVTAREQYEHQEFKFAGPVGDYGFLEDYTSSGPRRVHRRYRPGYLQRSRADPASRSEPPASQRAAVLLPLDA